MKKTYCQRLFGLLTLTGALLLASCRGPVETEKVSLLPQPAHVEETPEQVFVISSGTTIGYNSPELLPAAVYLSEILGTASIKEGAADITLSLTTGDKEGAYTLVTTAQSADISGCGYSGVIAGIETLRQLLPAGIEAKQKTNRRWGVPAVRITDSPRYAWRGLMLDVSRHFYSKEEVMELLDLMALYKMNKFHWHLTDDQGWRVEIKQYPLLTEKGAWRHFNSHDRECIRLAKAQDNPDYEIPTEKLHIENGDTLYGGFYTQDDVREIVQYAGIRGIDVVPEIDMPGHMLAAVSNYSGVACTDNTGWGTTFSSPACPGKDTAIEFCQNVYKEIFQLFPYKYVHIGGDEVEKTNWKKCPDCQKRMRDNGLKTEEQLQAWFTHQMEEFFNANGKEMIGWDEIIEGGLSETSTVMWWRSWAKNASREATAHGNKVIYTPNSPFYLDYQQDKKSVRAIYDYVPELEGMTAEQQQLIMGVQGNIWCEWIPSRERMLYMAAPRMLAIAELGWSGPKQDNWEDFRHRMTDQFNRLNVMDIPYRIPDLEGFNESNAFIGETTVEVSCFDPTAVIRYTTDGSIPTAESALYEAPIPVSETTDFTFRTFRANGAKGDFVKTRFVKSEYAPATQTAPSSPGLSAAWHDFRGNRCADIDQAPLKGRYKIEDVCIPKKVSGNIGLVVKGYLNAPVDDIYSFALLSDDGSTLVIDGDMVVDNDGPHAPKEMTGQKALKKGYHPFELRYFDSNGGMLQLKVTGSDGKVVPFTNLYMH